MRKYLWLLAPVVCCSLLSAFLLISSPSELHTGGYTPNKALAVYWFFLGLGASFLLLLCLLVHDFFAWLERRRLLRLAAQQGRRAA